MLHFTINRKLCIPIIMFIGVQFLEQIKGQEALNEEFLIPRPAFDAIAEEYDGLLEEVDDWKVWLNFLV